MGKPTYKLFPDTSFLVHFSCKQCTVLLVFSEYVHEVTCRFGIENKCVHFIIVTKASAV